MAAPRLKASELRAFCLGAAVASAVLLAGGPAVPPSLGSWRAPWSLGAVYDHADLVRRLEECQKAEPCKAAEEEGLALPLWATLPIIVCLVLLSGLFSGLTLGLLGLDLNGLAIVEKGGDPKLARCAAKIAPVRANGNMLLCTLLLGNVAVNSALSILTADLASGLIGFFASTALIVIFGEIIPQACCSRYALQVGAFTVPIVKFLILLFFLITWPMSKILDCLLGEELGTVMSRDELLEMLKMQIALGAVDKDEGAMAQRVAEGALNFRDNLVKDIMTPIDDTFMLSAETKLGYDTIRAIFETGFSRVPVYGKDKHDFVGLLYTKDLMLADPEDEMKLGDFIPIFHRNAETFLTDAKLIDALNIFAKGGTHLGLVRHPKVDVSTSPCLEILGVLTLEDIMEEIIQKEIVDETDVYVDVDNQIRVGDGREHDQINIGIFDPIWDSRRARLSADEISAVASHLSRVVFSQGSALQLGIKAVEWLVASSEVKTKNRKTQFDVEEPVEDDWLYRFGVSTDTCMLVLQGRVNMRVGREGFACEGGAFSVMGKEVLLGTPKPDFSAYLSTKEVRLLFILKDNFVKAQEIDKDPVQLAAALSALGAYSAGEVSRKEARELRLRAIRSCSVGQAHSGRRIKQASAPTAALIGRKQGDEQQQEQRFRNMLSSDSPKRDSSRSARSAGVMSSIVKKALSGGCSVNEIEVKDPEPEGMALMDNQQDQLDVDGKDQLDVDGKGNVDGKGKKTKGVSSASPRMMSPKRGDKALK